MNVKKSLEERIRGWFPKEPNLPSNKLKINSEEQKGVKIQFTKRFWVSLALSYLLFLLLIVLPFLLGYIDSTILGYGLAGIVEGLILMVMVRMLNRADMVLRKRIGYVVLGVWLGFLVGFFGVTLLFGPSGSLANFVLAIIVLPLAGGLIGYGAGKSFISITPLITEDPSNVKEKRVKETQG